MNDIKVLRKKVGMKQCVLAKELGVEQSNYANIENGKLITSKIPEIRQKALEILLPKLDHLIIEKELEYFEVKHLRQHFNQA